MTSSIPRTLCLLFTCISLTACDLGIFPGKAATPSLSKEAIATRDAPARNIFQGQLAGEPTFLLLHNCEVFRVTPLEKGEVHWESVLAPDFYPFWTVCDRQSMSVKNGELTVMLGRMAFGAGGCCATGGTYRSVDGRTWKQIS